MVWNNQPNNNRGYGPKGGYTSSIPTLPTGYLNGGYYRKDETDKPTLKPEYIIQYPQKIAGNLKDRSANKSTQLRKFYDYCIRLRDMMKYQNLSFSTVESDLKRLVPFVQYAQSRKRVTPLFVDFITENMNAIHNEADFRAFLKHFEAVIAYLPKDQ